MRYSFTNWTDEPFTGRFSGDPYEFAPGETKEFDPDKHYMLVVMSKQLADRELVKGIVGVGRDPNNLQTYGKSLDAEGKIYKPGIELRKEMMRKAIGALVDTPVPTPEQPTEEAGATQGTSEDMQALKDQVQNLTELVQTLTSKIGEVRMPPATVPVTDTPPVAPHIVNPTATVEEPQHAEPGVDEPKKGMADMSLTREILVEMAGELGIEVGEDTTKEELIEAINAKSS